LENHGCLLRRLILSIDSNKFLGFAKYQHAPLDLQGAAVKFYFGAIGSATIGVIDVSLPIPAAECRRLLPLFHWVTLLSTLGKMEQDHEYGDVA
jgi:hypothetical protein